MDTSLTPPPSAFDPEAVEQSRRRHGLDPNQVRRFRKLLYKNFGDDESVLSEFPWTQDFDLHCLKLFQRFDSQVDGATKLVLQTASGMLIETVILRIDTGRTTLCVSSQVGCAAACEFCATGRMGVAIDLSADEILDQVLIAGQLLAMEGRRIRNLVFMGMGEPFHNEANLHTALRTLLSTAYFNHPAKRILVSSVGEADAMMRCAEAFPNVGLALSLHSVRQDIRKQIIPLAAKHDLSALRRAIQFANQIQPHPVMIEYLMLADVNDSSQDAISLMEWLAGLRVHVNLIPFNAIDESALQGSERAVMHRFAQTLKDAGLKTTTRYSLGGDIGAACGQLIQQKNRKLARELSLKRHS